MLSVLIPVFNVDVNPLVSELYTQLEQLSVSFEIVVADDASTDSITLNQNSRIKQFENVRLLSFSENQGRSKIRNFLAKSAKYDYLLILDCDARVKNSDFIAKYLSSIREIRQKNDYFVISGGISYRKKQPLKYQKLRYKYGVKREVRSASTRNNNSYKSFTPFNVVVSKTVFTKCCFDETLTQYGYEDTFFGLDLKSKKIPIYHIDNPMYHDGIDDNETFLNKIDSSCENLSLLIKMGRVDDEFISNSRLLQVYFRLKSNFFGRFVLKTISYFSSFFRKIALNRNSLFALDMYKLVKIAD